jgi:queuine/archaeosine tRNA-ribosyltransferase
METLNTRLSGLNEGKENFYQTINKQKIDELYKGFVSSKHVEDLIFKTLTKIDSLENKHEEGAYIFLKLKEMIEQQDKLTSEIKENKDILTNLSSGMKSNIETMEKNLAYLKQRFAKIKK